MAKPAILNLNVSTHRLNLNLERVTYFISIIFFMTTLPSAVRR